ncbi:MAG: hypothetical protein ACIAQZ_16285 [Sedimentisphaeraceae bacterium JB056]
METLIVITIVATATCYLAVIFIKKANGKGKFKCGGHCSNCVSQHKNQNSGNKCKTINI